MDAPRVPMDERREDIERLLHEHDNGVIIGETGSGKTTRIPQFLLETFPSAKIAITQPRRIAARAAAGYVSARRGERVGGEVGYQVRFDNQTTSGTRANFLTESILVRQLSFDPLLQKYDIVMVDEAHERSLETDFLLGLLKRAQEERKKRNMPPLKILVTSATIEKEKFTGYFGNCPAIEVKGRMFPVDVHYAHEPIKNYTQAAAEQVKKIIQTGEAGDVLIFMPGEEEIHRTIAEIKALNISGVDILPLFGLMDADDQDKVFQKSLRRKIIVSTNIAETSTTIEGVRFVIDSGLIKEKRYNTSTGIGQLSTHKHAKSGCEQRKGRAGRTAPGVCYRLYTEQEYNQRPPFQEPEIKRTNLDNVILTMKYIGIGDVHAFDFIDKPESTAIDRSLETLKILGALDNDERLTQIGETMAELPLRPELARMIIEAEKYGCTGSITTIAAMLEEKSIFLRPKDKTREADQAHAAFRKENSDFLTMLEVWKQWSASGFNAQWANEHFLNVSQLFEIKEIRAQLMRELKKRNIPAEDTNATEENIQKSIVAGLIQHLLAYSSKHAYTYIEPGKKGQSIYIHPSSGAFSNDPKYMIGVGVTTTTKTFARVCQPVNPEWLPDIAPQILEEREKNTTYNPKSDTVEETIGYAIKGSYSSRPITERKRTVTNETRVREEFLRALIEGKVSLPAAAHNAHVCEALKSLRTRSGGLIDLPDMETFYRSHLGGAKSRQEAIHINDHLQLDINEYCPLETKAEIDQQYPEVIEVAGHRLVVSYEYRPANPDGYYESDRVETFKATITIPSEDIFDIFIQDIPKIGNNNRPEVIYTTQTSFYSVFSDTNLDKVKAEVDEQRLSQVWYRFGKPEPRPVQVNALDTLPTPESLDLQPLVYAKDYQGNDVLAYPGYNVERRYDSTKGAISYNYSIEYFQSEREAKEANEKAEEYKKQEEKEELDRQDQETLSIPAQHQYTDMEKKMADLYSTWESYGFSSQEYQSLQGTWGQVSMLLHSDPRNAITLMDSIEKKLSRGRAEHQRRADIVKSMQTAVAAIADKMQKITWETYAQYGLTPDKYGSLQNTWQEIQNALSAKDSYGSPKLPDPERAATLMRELTRILPSETRITPEQEALNNIFSGRDEKFAQLVRVHNGNVTEYAHPLSTQYATPNPTEIPIGKAGRVLRISGNRLTFIFGGGSTGATFQLKDGNYIFSRDANTCIRVEENTDTAYGFRAITFINSSEYEDTEAPTLAYSEPDAGFGNAFGGLGSLLKKKEGEKPPREQKKDTTAPAPTKETAKPVEREKMTEEVRGELVSILDNARIFLDTVRAVPEPKDRKATNADKISKARQKAADAKKELNATETEVSTSDDAARARGKVGEIAHNAERLAKEMARLRNEREDWTDRFKQFSTRIGEIAKREGVEMNDALREKLQPKLVELAKQKETIDGINEELETILVDSV